MSSIQCKRHRIVAAMTFHDDRDLVVTEPVEGPVMRIGHVLHEIHGVAGAFALNVDD